MTSGLAIAQAPEKMPFLIFIDVNVPQEPSVPLVKKKWFTDIKKILNDRPVPTAANPGVFNALFITNFAYYYAGQDATAAPGESLTFISPQPKHKACPDKSKELEILEAIHDSIGRYSRIPREL